MTDLAPLAAEAQAYCDKGQWSHAQTCLEELYAKGHRPAFTALQLGDVCTKLGSHQEAIRWHRQAIALEPNSYRSHENLIFILDAQAETTNEDAKAARLAWWEQFGVHAYAQRPAYTNAIHPYKRLRVGYVTGDCNEHSAAIAWASVVARHTSAIEPVLYSTLELTKYDYRTRLWIEQFGDHFIDVHEASAHTLATQINADEIDILVDLSGYTHNNRLLSFAYKPAPVQVQAWGYVQGTASPMFEALFADPVVASPSVREHLTERVVTLPSILTFLAPSKASGAQTDLPGPTPLPCLTHGPTFCVFQRAMKITDQGVAVWKAILERLPDARIMFKGGDYTPTIRERILTGFGACQNRITFESNTRHFEHLLWYQEADLSLDPWPQTGGISTLESLWMHVPCVTLVGERLIQRTSASFLTTLGLSDFIAETPEDYIDIAVRMVTTDRSRLAAVRASARTVLEHSPIIVGYVDRVEQAYRQLWQEWCVMQGPSKGIH